MRDSVFLVAFFKFHEKGPEFGFKRIDLTSIFKTEEEARRGIFFCDEAGWYEGVLIEERPYGHQFYGPFKYKRIWLIQDNDGNMIEFDEPVQFKNIVNMI